MTDGLRYGSLFTGAGGFDLGCDAAGWACRWQVEKDVQCRSVLERHWPDVPRHGDIRDINGADLEPVDVITYGFPCQDVSQAGGGAGLSGDRSGLFFEAVRIINEMRSATDGRFPRWAVAENVSGLLTNNQGEGMVRVVETLADSGAVVVEWGVMDAQFFGVPQRRRRVFVIAGFDPRADRPGRLLPVSEGSAWDHRTRRKARAIAAAAALGRTNIPGITGTVTSTDGGADFAHAAAGLLVPISFDSKFSGQFHINADGLAATVRTQNAPPAVMIPSAWVKGRRAASTDDCETWGAEQIAPTMNVFDNGSDTRAAVLVDDGDVVRRLTPVEQERLFGWPDGHTELTSTGKRVAKTRRNQMIGNGVAAPAGQWVAEQISAADNEMSDNADR